jgi:hypothetical protein
MYRKHELSLRVALRKIRLKHKVVVKGHEVGRYMRMNTSQREIKAASTIMELPPPMFIPSSKHGHSCAIPHYLYSHTNLQSLQAQDKFYFVKVGREVGLHIDEYSRQVLQSCCGRLG